MSRPRHPLYVTWLGMRSRCSRPTATQYRWYGARGIRVCDRWSGADGFANFLADMGPKPSPKHSLDRINTNGNYEPGNCRWATQTEQVRNATGVKLSIEKAREIRAKYAAGGVSQPALASEYGVDQALIWAIVHNKRWQESP